MSNRVLVITFKPDVLHMIDHNGSFKEGDLVYSDLKGATSRSERESFRNIKTKEKAQAIVSRRNPKQILVATYNKSAIFPIK